MSDDPQQIPLEQRHRELGARMTEFAGFRMPVQYEGVRDEHRAVRNRAGLFDISHMGQVEIRGPEAIRAADSLVTNEVASLDTGGALYAAMCNEEGGIVDDVVAYRLADERVFVCVNAANREKDVAHMEAHATGDAEVVDRSDEFAQFALQGPDAEAILGACTEAELSSLSPFEATEADVAGVPSLVSRTGYTGEDGFELYVEAELGAEQVFDRLIEAGQPQDLALCGLGARDTLRIEVMYNLYGQDVTEEHNPYEGRMGWTVELDKETPFVGREALREVADRGPDRRLRGFLLEGRGVIRSGYPIFVDGDRAGTITSGTHSPTLDESIGMGYLDADVADADRAEIEIRDRRVEASVRTKPFYSR